MSKLSRALLSAAGNAAPAAEPNVADVFSTYLYDGSHSETITNGIDLSGKGGLVWVKSRGSSSTYYKHYLVDTERGQNQRLSTNLPDGEVGQTGVSAFNSDGFTVAPSDGVSSPAPWGGPYVSWTFRKAPRFFDVVTYIGNGASSGSPQTLNHSLGTDVGMILVKQRNDSGTNWFVYHKSLGENKFMLMNLTGGAYGYNGGFSSVGSTSFNVFDSNSTSGKEYVAYLFAHDPTGENGNDGMIACGDFTGNGGSLQVDLGWEPQYIMVKRSEESSNWFIYDSMRGVTTYGGSSQNGPKDGTDNYMVANRDFPENEGNTPNNYIDFNANGFSVNHPSGTGELNENGVKQIYMAIRAPMMKEPESGQEVYEAITYTATNSGEYTLQHLPYMDLFFHKRLDEVHLFNWYDRFRGTHNHRYNLDFEDADGWANLWDKMNILKSPSNTGAAWYGTNIGWAFKRAKGFLDIVPYTGNGTVRTIKHSLGVVPEMIILINRNSGTHYTMVQHKDIGINSYLNLSEDWQVGSSPNSLWNQNTPTESVFSLGPSVAGSAASNEIDDTMIAYLFATREGVSKIGSYTGGTIQTIDCGFSNGARFVLIKRYTAGDDWFLWDTERGITTSSSDSMMLLNNPWAGEQSAQAWWGNHGIGPHSSGFTLDSTSSQINGISHSYIFLAIA